MQKLEYIALFAFALLSFTNLPVLAQADNTIQPIGNLPDNQDWEMHSIWDAPPGSYFARDKSGNALWLFYIPGPPYDNIRQPKVVFPRDLEKMIGTKDYLDLLYGPTTEEVVKKPEPPKQQQPKPSKTKRLLNHLNTWAQLNRVQPGPYSTFSGFVHPSGFLQGGVIQQPQFIQGTINY